MFILHAALKLVNKGINKYLRLDPECEQRLQALEPGTINIHLEQVNLDFYIVIDHGISLQRHYDGEVTTTISGTPQALLKLLIHKKTTGKLLIEGVSIRGDLDIVQNLISIMQSMEIDWHGFLAKFTGDMTAYQLLQQAKMFKQFLTTASNSLRENTSEYLLEEARLVVSPVEVTHFCDQVGQLRHDVERLTKRLQRYQASKES